MSDALGGGDKRQLADPELEGLFRAKIKPLREIFLYYAGLEEKVEVKLHGHATGEAGAKK